MKGGIEHRYLWNTRTQNLYGGVNSLEIGRIVKRRQFDAIFNAFDDIVTDRSIRRHDVRDKLCLYWL